MSGAVVGRRRQGYDAALHLLDRQIVDPDRMPLGKVDDLELTEGPDGALVVTALLTGPGALGPRLGGRIGRWWTSAWRHARGEPHPQVARIPMTSVVEISSEVRVVGPRATLAGLFPAGGAEGWLDVHVVRALPGAGHEPG